MMNGAFFLMLPVLFQAMPGPGRVLTLAQATEQAAQSQPLLRQARAQTSAAFARADQARAPLLPQITGTANYSRSTANFAARPGALPTNQTTSGARSSFDTFDYWNFGLNASQVIYEFGQTRGRWRAAEASAEGQAQTERATRQDTVLSVRTAFFRARAERALVSVAKDTLDNQDRHLKQIQGFVELGARPAIDLAQSRTEVANAKVSVITAENAYATAKAQLNQAMGIAAPLDYEVAPDTLAPVEGEDQPTDALVQIALTSRPELVAAKKQIQAQEQLLRSARGNYAPTLSASTGVTDAGRSLDNLTWNWNAGVQITWPLFQGLAVPAQVREAEANIAVAKAQRDGEEQQLRLEVEQARLAVRAAKASILAVEEAVQNARERLRLAEGRYQTGVGNAIELGDAQNAKSTSEGERVRADYDLATARAQLLRALGRD